MKIYPPSLIMAPPPSKNPGYQKWQSSPQNKEASRLQFPIPGNSAYFRDVGKKHYAFINNRSDKSLFNPQIEASGEGQLLGFNNFGQRHPAIGRRARSKQQGPQYNTPKYFGNHEKQTNKTKDSLIQYQQEYESRKLGKSKQLSKTLDPNPAYKDYYDPPPYVSSTPRSQFQTKQMFKKPQPFHPTSDIDSFLQPNSRQSNSPKGRHKQIRATEERTYNNIFAPVEYYYEVIEKNKKKNKNYLNALDSGRNYSFAEGSIPYLLDNENNSRGQQSESRLKSFENTENIRSANPTYLYSKFEAT